MTVVNQNVKLYRGDTATVAVTVTQADGSSFDPGVGAVFKYWVAKTRHALEHEALIVKTLAEGIAITPTGVNITLRAEDTDLAPNIYYHELKVWDGDDVATAMTGFFIVRHAITRGGEELIPDAAAATIEPGSPTV